MSTGMDCIPYHQIELGLPGKSKKFASEIIIVDMREINFQYKGE